MRYGFDFIFTQRELRNLRISLGRRFRLPEPEFLNQSLPERARLLLQELGPTYIKLGQILSSRNDILPDEFITPLRKLQDQVPPFPFEQVRQIIQKELGAPLETIYAAFDPEPIAAASIGQVHNAILMNGDLVVVKVQRPGIKDRVLSDMELLRLLVRSIETTLPWAKRYGVVQILDEFDRTIQLEMDYRYEGSNADNLRRILAEVKHVRVPRIYWDQTSERVLTMERIQGVKIDALSQIDAAGLDRQDLAKVFIESIFTQLLQYGFYHADPHAGNLIIDLEEHSLVYIDLGMMGRLLPNQTSILEDLVLSIFRRDSEDVTRLLLRIGTPFHKVDEKHLLREIDQILNRYLSVSLDRLEFATLLAQVLATVFRHNLRLPSEYSLAIKTLMQCEYVARTLDPKISLVEIAEDIARKVVYRRITPAMMVDGLRDTSRELMRLKDVLPQAVESILRQLAEGKLTVAVDIPMFKWIVNTLIIIANRLVAGLIVTGMLVASALVMGTESPLGIYLNIIGFIGFGVALILGGTVVWSVVLEIQRTEKRKKEDM